MYKTILILIRTVLLWLWGVWNRSTSFMQLIKILMLLGLVV